MRTAPIIENNSDEGDVKKALISEDKQTSCAKLMSVSTMIITMVVLQVVAAVVVVWLVTFFKAEQSLDHVSQEFTRTVQTFGNTVEEVSLSRVRESIEAFLINYPMVLGSIIGHIASMGIPPVTPRANMEFVRYMVTLMKVYPLNYVFYGTEADHRMNGVNHYYQTDRWSIFDTITPMNNTVSWHLYLNDWNDGWGNVTVSNEIEERYGSYDPTKRGWYVVHKTDPVARAERGIWWSSPYTSISPPSVIISASKALWDGDELIGVVGMDLLLQEFRALILKSLPSQHSVVFLVQNDGTMLSASRGNLMRDTGLINQNGLPEQDVMNAFQSNDTLIVHTAHLLAKAYNSTNPKTGLYEPFYGVPVSNTTTRFRAECCPGCCPNGGALILATMRLRDPTVGLDWVIASAIPEADLLLNVWQSEAESKRVIAESNKIVIGLCAGVLVIAVLFAVATSYFFISKPLSKLKQEMVRIAALEFQPIGHVDTPTNNYQPSTEPWRGANPGIHRPSASEAAGGNSVVGSVVTVAGVTGDRVSLLYEVGEMQKSVRQMKNALSSFEKYVPSELVRQVLNEGRGAELGVRFGTVTMFFSDLENFTGYTENLPPEDLVALMAEYLEQMSDIIQHERGVVDKFIGDAIMAFWNAPRPLVGHSAHACRAALRCKERLAELSVKWVENGFPRLNARIGINVGRVLVGNIGAPRRFNYTLLGDEVNLSSRLEGLNKHFRTNILVTQSVVDAVGQEFVTPWLGLVSVKGKTQATHVYELCAARATATQAQLDKENAFHRVLAASKEGDIATAQTAAAHLERSYTDFPAAMHLSRTLRVVEKGRNLNSDQIYRLLVIRMTEK